MTENGTEEILVEHTPNLTMDIPALTPLSMDPADIQMKITIENRQLTGIQIWEIRLEFSKSMINAEIHQTVHQNALQKKEIGYIFVAEFERPLINNFVYMNIFFRDLLVSQDCQDLLGNQGIKASKVYPDQKVIKEVQAQKV